MKKYMFFLLAICMATTLNAQLGDILNKAKKVKDKIPKPAAENPASADTVTASSKTETAETGAAPKQEPAAAPLKVPSRASERSRAVPAEATRSGTSRRRRFRGDPPRQPATPLAGRNVAPRHAQTAPWRLGSRSTRRDRSASFFACRGRVGPAQSPSGMRSVTRGRYCVGGSRQLALQVDAAGR